MCNNDQDMLTLQRKCMYVVSYGRRLSNSMSFAAKLSQVFGEDAGMVFESDLQCLACWKCQKLWEEE